MHGPFAQGLQRKGWTAQTPGRNWVHQDPLFTCGRCERNGLECIIPRIERTRWDEVNRPVYRMSRCLACQKSNTLGGCSLVGPPWPQLEYHWADEGGWERKTVVWRMGLAGFWQPRPKAGLVTLKKDERVGTEEGKAKENSTSATVISGAGSAGEEPQPLSSDARPFEQHQHEGIDDDEPAQRLHPNSPASLPPSPSSNTKYDPDQPVSQLPSPDPFSDSNEILYQSSRPSSSVQYTTPPVNHRAPKHFACERDRRSPPIILDPNPLNDRPRRPISLPGARHLTYPRTPIPRDSPFTSISEEPSRSTSVQIRSQDSQSSLNDRLPSISPDSVKKEMFALAHQLCGLGFHDQGVRYGRRGARGANQTTSPEPVERGETPQSDNID
jgi:hypothetical protein